MLATVQLGRDRALYTFAARKVTAVSIAADRSPPHSTRSPNLKVGPMTMITMTVCSQDQSHLRPV
jgi:hypothetical protein